MDHLHSLSTILGGGDGVCAVNSAVVALECAECGHLSAVACIEVHVDTLSVFIAYNNVSQHAFFAVGCQGEACELAVSILVGLQCYLAVVLCVELAINTFDHAVNSFFISGRSVLGAVHCVHLLGQYLLNTLVIQLLDLLVGLQLIQNSPCYLVCISICQLICL